MGIHWINLRHQILKIFFVTMIWVFVSIPEEYRVESVGETQFRGKELYTNLFYIWPNES